MEKSFQLKQVVVYPRLTSRVSAVDGYAFVSHDLFLLGNGTEAERSSATSFAVVVGMTYDLAKKILGLASHVNCFASFLFPYPLLFLSFGSQTINFK